MRAVLILGYVLFGAFEAAADGVRGVSGRWYMEGEEQGIYLQYLVNRTDDGKYAANIRTPKICDARAEPWIQTGSWTFRDGTLYTRTETAGGQTVNPDDPENQDAFVVTVIDDDHATLYDDETKITWAARRVGADFKFPVVADCAV